MTEDARNSNHPPVSIIIPVYNGSNYMRDAIDSALAQSYDNIEILLINDGSNDDGATESIALSYGNKIRYFSKNNGGVATALNMGILHMRGEYFSWLSHDDIFHAEKIEKQIQCALLSGKEFIYSGYELINPDAEAMEVILPNALYPTDNALLHLFRGAINGCTVMLHRSLFDRFGVFDTTRLTTQDYALWWEILRTTETAYLNEALVKTRIHPDRGTLTIPGHAQEADALWLMMLSSLTFDECKNMMRSPYAFFKSTADFLLNTPYTTSTHYAFERAKTLSAELDI